MEWRSRELLSTLHAYTGSLVPYCFYHLRDTFY